MRIVSREGPHSVRSSPERSASDHGELPVHAAHQMRERDGLGRGLLVGLLLGLLNAAGAGRVGEDLVGHVEDLVDRLGLQRVRDLAERPEAGAHVLGLGAERLADHVRRLVGAIIGVLTSGMWMVVKVTPSPTTSEPTHLVNASSAALEAT